MNYAALFDAVKGYVENDFPNGQFTDSAGTGTTNFTGTEQINLFIRQAEERIYNTVQFPSLRKNVTGQISMGNKYLSAPVDFLAVYSIAVIDENGDYEYLLNKDVNYIREAYPRADSIFTMGKPRFYALFGPATTNANPPVITTELTFLLGPTPNAAYDVELHYFYYPESIITAGTSWLGDNFDTVLLYGTLLEAYTYMKGEPDVLVEYKGRYVEAIALAKRLGGGMERRDAYRSGQTRVPVE
jgi:hypothetical protein